MYHKYEIHDKEVAMVDKDSSEKHGPLLAINPTTGIIVLLIKGSVIAFKDFQDLEAFVDHIIREFDAIKPLTQNSLKEGIENGDAELAISSWEEQLKNMKASQKKNIDNEAPLKEVQINIKSDNQESKANRLTGKTNSNFKNANEHPYEYPGLENPSSFDPKQISWVTDDLAITNKEGGSLASSENLFVINVAGEIMNPNCDEHIPINPYNGPEKTRRAVTKVARIINKELVEGKQVVVHCAMGMERSVLCVVWYLNQYCDMAIDDAYDLVRTSRPIAVDRRHWIGFDKENGKHTSRRD